MSKELNFQFGDDVLKYEDSNSALNLYLSENGIPFDLSRFDYLSLKIGNENGYLLENEIDLNSIKDPEKGNLTIPLGKETMDKLVPGDYNVEIWGSVNPILYLPEANEVNIIVSDRGLQDSQAIFPSDGNLVITVDDNIDSSPYETINAYAIDEIKEQIDQWENDLTTSIKNNISNQLIETASSWQGDSAEKLKTELIQEIANDAQTIQKPLNEFISNSLNNLIKEEVSTSQSQVANDLYSSLAGNLNGQLSTAMQGWASSASSSFVAQNNSLSSAVDSAVSAYKALSATYETNQTNAQIINDNPEGYVQNQDGSRSYVFYGKNLTGRQVIGDKVVYFNDNGQELTEQDGEVLDYTNDLPVQSEAFDKKWGYSGNDLGATYTNTLTKLKVWAPTAQNIQVFIYDNPNTEDVSKVVNMYRGDTFDANDHSINNAGVWYANLHGSYLNHAYKYKITFPDGTVHYTNDSYNVAVSNDGTKSVIVDLNQTDPNNWTTDYAGRVSSAIQARVGEVHVRDFTISQTSGVDDDKKGKFVGMFQDDTTDPNNSNIKTGFNYLKNSGLNYIQIMPVFDTRYDDSIKDTKGWGYDPKNFNALNNWFSTDPSNPAQGIKEYKELIQAYHGVGIGIIMDVVYNHMFSLTDSSFDQTVPGYFFRYNSDGSVSNGSECGNDFRSEGEMGRNFILQSVKFWHEQYGVDGFRFDLMGNLDIQTGLLLEAYASSNNLIIYGEGWDNSSSLNNNDKMTHEHANEVSGLGYFNNADRDLIRGSNSGNLGFVNGTGFTGMQDLSNSLMGGINSVWGNNYTSSNQSVNYVECHDDKTLSDQIYTLSPNDSSDQHIHRVELANAMVALSQGVLFTQVGQSFGRTKNNSLNDYDLTNAINWDLLNTYQSMDNNFRDIVSLKQNDIQNNDWLLNQDNYGSIAYTVKIDNNQEHSGVISLTIQNAKGKYVIIFNASDNDLNVGKGANYDSRLTNNYSYVDFGFNNKFVTNDGFIQNGLLTLRPLSYAVAHFSAI